MMRIRDRNAMARATATIWRCPPDSPSTRSRVEEILRRLRSDVNLSGIFVRDYLLDVARERAPEYREQIATFRRTTLAHCPETADSTVEPMGY